MAKILAPFEYNIDIKNLWDIKTTSGSTKILVYLKTNGYGKNRMRSQRRLWALCQMLGCSPYEPSLAPIIVMVGAILFAQK